MSIPANSFQTGLLLGFRRGRVPLGWSERIDRDREAAGVRGWSEFSFVSSVPLMNELPSDGQEQSYKYQLLLRRSGGHFLLFGPHAPLVEFYLESFGFQPLAYCPVVEVARLVSDLAEAPSDVYVMSAVHARVETAGQSLRTISFYGGDVGDARLFKEDLAQLQAYRVTLRKTSSGQEILSVSSRGVLGFAYMEPKSLGEVDGAIRYLSERNYIDWSRQLVATLR